MTIDPRTLNNTRAAIVRIDTQFKDSSSRVSTATFVSRRHLVTAWEGLKGINPQITLKGQALTHPARAEIVATVPESNLALLRLVEEEPIAKHHLQLASTFPTERSTVHFFGYTRSENGWYRGRWTGRLSTKLGHCKCRKARCIYGREKRGWAMAIVRMPSCEGGWGGGPVVNAITGEILSLAVEAMDYGEPWQNRALLLGANLSSIHDLMQQASS